MTRISTRRSMSCTRVPLVTALLFPVAHPAIGGKEKTGSGWAGSSFGNYPEQPSWHDEILLICRDTGLESLATETGLIQSGEVAGLRNYNPQRTPGLDPSTSNAAEQGFPPKPSLVNASELAQALLSPTTPSSAANTSFTSDVTPSCVALLSL